MAELDLKKVFNIKMLKKIKNYILERLNQDKIDEF